MKININKTLVCGFLFFLFAISCKHNDKESVIIHRFETDTHNFSSKNATEKQTVANKYADVIKLYIDKIYTDTTLSESAKLDTFANSKAINFFYDETIRQFSDITELEAELGKERANLSSKYGISFPTIYSAIIPYNQSVMLNDTIAIIGLNHYLGKDYKPYEYFPEYKRHFKIKEKIKYDLAEAILKINFEFQPKSNTLLEKMIYEGLIAAAAQEIIPEYTDSLYFSFTQEKNEWCIAHEKQIWEQLLIEDILYSTSDFLKSALLEPAPFSEYLSNDSPGRTCSWVGKKIVEKHIRNNRNSTIKELLSNRAYQNSQTFLIESEYDGQQ